MVGRRPGRRELLRSAVLGAGMAAVPTLVGGPGAGVASAAAPTGGPPLPDILRDDTYPIGFWWPPPPGESTAGRYAEIAAAGFTFVTGGNGVANPSANADMLAAAGANDLRAIVIDDRISAIQTYPPDQWEQVIAETLREYQRYPAFTAFNIRDEPNASLFGQIGTVNDALRRLDPHVLGYVNLFPTYANSDQLGTPTYDEHLARYVAEGRPAFLSFDHYMLFKPDGVRADYFYNWVLVRNEALRSGLASWVFIQACEHLAYRLPTEAELRWQVNVSLAYGCKGIQYFTYWTPEPPEVFQQALVSRDGTPTGLYFAAQRINRDYLRPVGRQLLPLTSESVTHFGEADPPMGVEVFTGDDWVASATGDAAILSRFRAREADRTRWLLVANRAFDTSSTTTLTLARSLRAVEEFETSAERFVPVYRSGGPAARTLRVRLGAGEARLYRLHRD